MKKNSNKLSLQEQKNIKDLRESATKKLSKNFDKKVMSENGLKIDNITYKYNLKTCKWNKEQNIIKEKYINKILDHKPLKHYIKVVSKRLWNTLPEDTKEVFKLQINYLENIVLAGKKIKLRVNPKIICILKKILWVHDLKWWAYWWTTIYLWHASDLFNEQIVRHEWIHVLQQQELWWFIPRLIEEAKEISKYKKENVWINQNIKYDITSKIPTEAESYSNQLVDDYIANREEKVFLKWWQKQIESIEESNYSLDKKTIECAIETAIENNNMFNLYYLYNDLKILEKFRIKQWNSKEPILRMFNHLDKIEDITRVIKVLEKKLEEMSMKDGNSKKLNKMIKQCRNEIANENVLYMVEDDFTDKNLIKKTINDLEQKSHNLRAEPTCIRLERPEQVESWKLLEEKREDKQKEKYGEKKWKEIRKVKKAKFIKKL